MEKMTVSRSWIWYCSAAYWEGRWCETERNLLIFLQIQECNGITVTEERILWNDCDVIRSQI